MNSHLSFFLLSFTSLLAIVNPLSAVPIYLAMTTAYDPRHRTRTLRRAIVTAAVVMVAFALLGNWILRFFGIGWDMLQAGTLVDAALLHAAVLVALAVSWLILAAAPAVIHRLGRTGLNVLTRIMGLLVMVMGAQFVINGVTVVKEPVDSP